MPYDFELILRTDAQDATLRRLSNRLFEKAPGRSAHFAWDVAGANNQVTHLGGAQSLPERARIRVYIVGHGNISQQYVANATGIGLAAKFAALPVVTAERTIGRISIISCFATSVSAIYQPHTGIAPQPNNFARAFHYALRHTHGIVTEVSARGALVDVDERGHIQTGFYVGDQQPMAHRMPDTKWIFFWGLDGRQRMRRPRLAEAPDESVPMDIDPGDDASNRMDVA